MAKPLRGFAWPSRCGTALAAAALLASPAFLWSVVPVAVWASASALHPFDLLYNHGLRHHTDTGPLPRRCAPSRFACGLGAVWLIVTGLAFHAGANMTGYALGWMLTLVGLLVSIIDICIPSLIYRSIFGFPPKSRDDKA